MRKYSEMPSYLGKTEADAKFSYARDLLDQWMQPEKNKPCAHMKDGCENCAFGQRIDHGRLPKCCGWAVEENPDLAIIILEELLGKGLESDTLTICRIALDNGTRFAMDIAQEECAELIQAISKCRRGYNAQANIEEEIADVQIMLDQLTFLLKAQDRVKLWRQRKLDRQLERMEEAE